MALLECRLVARSTTAWTIAAATVALFIAPALLIPDGSLGTVRESPLLVVKETHALSAHYWFQAIDLFVIVLPLFAFLFGYGTFSRGREEGTLAVLGSLPLTRSDIYVGACFARLGLFSALLALGMLVGWVCASAIDTTTTVIPSSHLVVGIPTVLFGTALLALALALSALFKTRLQALTAAIICYFSLILATIFILLYVPLLFVGHPFNAYSTLIALPFDSLSSPLTLSFTGSNNPTSALAYVGTESVAVVVLLGWICCSLAIGWLGFQREVLTG